MDDHYYFCLKHHTVEDADGCGTSNRLGPYDSRADAQNALAKVEERNKDWDNDPRWNDELED